jgi:hypothetical protein
MTNSSMFKKSMNNQNLFKIMAATMLLLVVLSIMPKSAFANPIVWMPNGGNWTVTDSVYSVSYVSNVSPVEQRLIDLNSQFANFSMEADIHFADNSNHGNAGFIFRMNNPTADNGGSDSEYAYYAGIGRAGTYVVLGNEHYGYSQPGSATMLNNSNNTYLLKVVVIGNSIKVYVDNILKIDITDNTYTTGMIGLRAFDTDVSYSNLIINDFIAPTTTPTQSIDNITKFVTVNLQVSDSTSTTTYYKVDNGSPITTGNSIVLNTDGIHLITYWSVDQAGNTEFQKHKIIKVDLNSLDNVGLVSIVDVVKLLNQQNQNGIGVFNTNDIKLILEAISPISTIAID